MSAETDKSDKYVHRVMAAIDESETSQNAFIFYMETLHHPKDKIIFAHCTEPPYIGTGLGVAGYGFVSGDLYEQMLKQRRDDVARLRDRYVNLLRGRHLDYRIHAVEFGGNPGEGLVKIAEEVRADMIVMGSRGLGSVRRTVLGSVSDYVIHHAHCPVMVWHNPNHHHHHQHHHHLHLQDQTAYKKL